MANLVPDKSFYPTSKMAMLAAPEKLAYVVGAGENGYSYIIRRGDFLFQAPLSFYTKSGTWDLSPGHELGFNRPIPLGCAAFHSGSCVSAFSSWRSE